MPKANPHTVASAVKTNSNRRPSRMIVVSPGEGGADCPESSFSEVVLAARAPGIESSCSVCI
jgi:hypothetical protein